MQPSLSLPNTHRPQPSAHPLRIVHIITTLNTGGAETVLYRLVTSGDSTRFHHVVVSLSDLGHYGPLLQLRGIRCEALGLNARFPNPLLLLKLGRLIREVQPALIQSWLYHSDWLTGFIQPFFKDIPIVWNIRGSLDAKSSSRFTLWTARRCAHKSATVPHTIVSCAEASKQIHVDLGYDASKICVIPNGIPIDTFKPDTRSPSALHQKLRLEPETPLIGYVARWDPQKDHKCFFLAAELLHASRPECRFVLCGQGIDSSNAALTSMIPQPIRDKTYLLGVQTGLPALLPGLRIGVSTAAYGEGFPNTIGELMACGIPCVVTDVGDSKQLVGDTGHAVAVRDPAAAAAAWKSLLDYPSDAYNELAARARRRIETHFSLEQCIHRYETLYTNIGVGV